MHFILHTSRSKDMHMSTLGHSFQHFRPSCVCRGTCSRAWGSVPQTQIRPHHSWAVRCSLRSSIPLACFTVSHSTTSVPRLPRSWPLHSLCSLAAPLRCGSRRTASRSLPTVRIAACGHVRARTGSLHRSGSRLRAHSGPTGSSSLGSSCGACSSRHIPPLEQTS